MKKNRFLKIFIISIFTVFCFAVFYFLFLSPKPSVAFEPITNIHPTATIIIEETSSIPPATSAPTDTPIPTPTPTPIFSNERAQIRLIMEEYGHVDEKYLTDVYWENLNRQITTYGPAERVLTLEFHGDSYDMSDFHYVMTPEQFEIQMRYLLDNDYHFVTGPEIIGFLEGWLTLPARSIILTTDSGQGSRYSFERITTLFQKLEVEYGVSPHMHSYIWTALMTSEENYKCPDDSCWQFFRDALQSGYFTFGSHSETHSDFGMVNYEFAKWDLSTSIQEIHDSLGLTIYSLAWPFETCYQNTDLLTSLGLKYAYGGYPRGRDQLFTYTRDNMPLCLPRLFPPSTDGYSGRPRGLTLEQMLIEATDRSFPLLP